VTGLPGAGVDRKDLASACVLCPCPSPLSYLARSLITEGNRTKEGDQSLMESEQSWFRGQLGIIGDIQTEECLLERALLKYIKRMLRRS
jgi:hypothetical protein